MPSSSITRRCSSSVLVKSCAAVLAAVCVRAGMSTLQACECTSLRASRVQSSHLSSLRAHALQLNFGGCHLTVLCGGGLLQLGLG